MMEGKSKVALTFAIYQGDALIRRETIAQDIVKVGKDPRSHLRIDDDLASRMHAVIEVASAHDITLIDLGNEPGTMVNGQRVNKCKVRAGDQIQVGSTVVHLEHISEGDSVTAIAASPASESAPPPPVAHAPAVSAAPAANPFASGPASNPFASNPFVASAADASINAMGGSDIDPNLPVGYQMMKSGPDVSPDEVESHLAAIEVLVKWDDNTLHVSHLTPPRTFTVGEADACDYYVPSETIKTDRAPVVVSRGGGSAAVVIFPGTTGWVDISGQGRVTLQDLIATGRARPSSEVSGGHEFDLPANSKAHVRFDDGLTFEVSAVNAGKAPPVGMFASFDAAASLFVGLSFLLHAGIVLVFLFWFPKMGLDDSEGIDRDSILMMQKYLNAAAEREQEEKETDQPADANADNKEGGTGTRAKGEEGSMGNPNTQATGKRFGVQGPQDNPDPHLARQAALREAAEFGMVGLLNVAAGGDPNAPTAPWGREESLGNDPMSARGNMWGDAIGDSFGAGGLGLSGVGEGGGGRGEGIGLGNIGTIGHGAGTGTGQGFGNGHGRLGGAHQTRAPSIRQGATQVNGRLPPEVIQRIVRQNFGRFRLCYENGLRTNPNLAGRVSVKFVIDRSGAVTTSSDGGSDLPDQGVVGCVVRGFGNLSFPQPEGGIVTVVYPIIFNPGD